MLAALPFGQEAAWGDLGVVGLLILLEGVLSIDNALVLGLLARRLPKEQHSRALTYGLVGAFAFRVLAISVAAWLLRLRVVKLIGGGYLAYIAVKHLWFDSGGRSSAEIAVSQEGGPMLVDDEGQPLTAEEESAEIEQRVPLPMVDEFTDGRGQSGVAKFWPTVLVIELTDIAFAVDSILAAIGVVGPKPKGTAAEAIHPKLWVIITGGILGVILMRFAAVVFIKLLEKFPRFESAAYLLVLTIGAKLLLDWACNSHENPHALDFHDWRHSPFWIFWITMTVCFCSGFLPKRETHEKVE